MRQAAMGKGSLNLGQQIQINQYNQRIGNGNRKDSSYIDDDKDSFENGNYLNFVNEKVINGTLNLDEDLTSEQLEILYKEFKVEHAFSG